MKPAVNDLVINAFLDKYCSEEKRAKLLSFLSEEDQKKISSEEHISFEITAFTDQIDTLLDDVHYSWLLPTLKSYTKKDAGYFLLSLTEEQQEKIKKRIENLKTPRKELSSSAKTFFQNLLKESLIPEEFLLLPKEAIPFSTCKKLLSLSKSSFIQLIDYLSVYDLKAELKTIVDKRLIERIFSYLSEDKKKFLQEIKGYQEPLSLPKMGLEHWDGKAESFYPLLHKRGINRLAKALFAESPSLIWHLAHELDIGRGNILLNLCQQNTQEEMIKRIIEKNIEVIFDYLEQHKEERL